MSSWPTVCVSVRLVVISCSPADFLSREAINYCPEIGVLVKHWLDGSGWFGDFSAIENI
jgi:hypothetical protein